jgi:energy-coupling factor transporter ATP-binding protein EcfA2
MGSARDCFDGDDALFRLVSEVLRIFLAFLFDRIKQSWSALRNHGRSQTRIKLAYSLWSEAAEGVRTMALKIGTLEIHQFRALQQLKLDQLGRVNLLTGRNNTGKSSVLEALRILASNASSSVIYDILRFREEDSGEIEEPARPLDAEGSFQWSSLFHGFPPFSPDLPPIVIAATGGSRAMRVSIGGGWLSEERDSEGVRRLVPLQRDLFGEAEAIPALVIEASGERRVIHFSLTYPRRYPYRGRVMRPDSANGTRLPCIFAGPYGGEETTPLGVLWDTIALSDREQHVVEALRIIDPEISAVSMVGGEGPRKTRTAIVRAAGLPRPVPLRSFGDGLNRLFGVALSLVNAKDGLLLIDEFENGLHHTVQTDAWRTIFKLASHLDIQVMATSHSWDAIEAFQTAARESPEEGVLIRLSRRDGEVVPTMFREDELAIATRERIEVR